jgi:hypothetical protein
MENEKWEILHEVAGKWRAEILQGLLSSFGIDTLLSQDAAGPLYGIIIPSPLGNVQLLVQRKDLIDAKAILKDFQDGKLKINNSND